LSIRVRRAKPDDLPALTSLLGELLAAVTQKKGLDSLGFAANLDSLLGSQGHRLLVAEHEGRIAGFLNLSIRRTCLHSGPSGLIDEVVVGKAYRRTGVAGTLLEAAIEECRQLGCSEIEVSTEPENKAALSFYESIGFERRGLLLELELG